MLRTALVKKYVNSKDIQWIIGHSPVVYLKGFSLVLLLLFLFYVIFALLNNSSPAEYWKWIFGGLGLCLFGKWVVSFLNLYMDCLILSKDSVTLFLWEGLLDYKTKIFSWNAISSLSWTQDSLGDKLFSKGDLVIKLEHDNEFIFVDIASPKKQIGKLTLLKEQFLSTQKQTVEKDLADDSEKFSILVEAMGEVIKDYMQKQDQ